MTIDYLIKLLENRISYLKMQKNNLEITGNLEEILKIDEEILTTETTLSQIRGL